MRVFWAFAVFLASALPAAALPFNVAEGKPVTITGEIGEIANMCCGWGEPPTAPLSSITDGVFLPESTPWQENTVWWDEAHAGSVNNVIEIDLQGLYSVTQVWLQADNNDAYSIYYRDALGAWIFRGQFGAVSGFGMTTRSAGIDPLLASGFRIDAAGGDAFYSVSEFQAIGEPIPEPATLLLFGSGLSALAVRRRSRKQ